MKNREQEIQETFIKNAEFFGTSVAAEVKRNIEKHTSDWGRLRGEMVKPNQIPGQKQWPYPAVY